MNYDSCDYKFQTTWQHHLLCHNIEKKHKWSLPCTEMSHVHEEKEGTGEGPCSAFDTTQSLGNCFSPHDLTQNRESTNSVMKVQARD